MNTGNVGRFALLVLVLALLLNQGCGGGGGGTSSSGTGGVANTLFTNLSGVTVRVQIDSNAAVLVILDNTTQSLALSAGPHTWVALQADTNTAIDAGSVVAGGAVQIRSQAGSPRKR